MNFENKKIMILGASIHAYDAIKLAKDKGLYVIATDPDPKAPGKALADESYDYSVMDTEPLLEICREKKVDGVFTMCAHLALPSYCEICTQLNLPCYGTKELFDLFYFKDRF